MKLFENPEIEVLHFNVEDIMADSVVGCAEDGVDCDFDFDGFDCDNEI